MWPNPQETAGLVTFTEEILNGKLYFLRSTEGSTEWLAQVISTFVGSTKLYDKQE